MVKKYDYLIVGAGLFGSTFANLAHRRGKRCLVIDKRPHLGGNVYCENVDGITIHKYGPHIFHTSDKKVWDYVNSFVPFNQFTLNIVAISNGKLYNLPFNMHTFYQMWGVTKPEDAVAIIERQKATANIQSPHNLEEQAISLVGHDVYETLIKGYTEKQWGRPCRELPADIIKRLPVRFSFNNNYFNDKYQGIPEGGYNVLIDGLLEGVECRTDCNYIDNRSAFEGIADKTIYTGPIDEFFGYRLGRLEYRSLRFEQEKLPLANFQGNAIVNYSNTDVPYTRVVEHKWFENLGSGNWDDYATIAHNHGISNNGMSKQELEEFNGLPSEADINYLKNNHKESGEIYNETTGKMCPYTIYSTTQEEWLKQHNYDY